MEGCVVYVCVYVYARTASHVFSLPAQNAAHRPLLVVVGGGWGRAVVGMVDGPCHGVTVVEMGVSERVAEWLGGPVSGRGSGSVSGKGSVGGMV